MTPKVLINWTYALSDQTGFLLQRRKSLSGPWTLDIATDGDTFNYTDTDVVVGDTCSYQVAATNSHGTGSFSNSGSVYITLGGPLVVYLTTTANNDIKPFDGTVSSSASPIVTPDITVFGDSHDLTQSFDTPLVGIDKTLSIIGGSIISASGNTYVQLTPVTNTGSITGPSTSSIDTGSYVLIPPNTDLPYDPDTFVTTTINSASGSNGILMIDSYSQGNIVLKTTNGFNWSGVGTASYYSQTIAYGNGRYVGFNIGNNHTQYSDDGGATWTPSTLPTTDLMYDALYDGTRFVACGMNGTIVTSSNGSDWGMSSTGEGEFANQILYNSGRYFIVGTTSQGVPGGTGKIYTSTNLVTWQAVSSSNIPTTKAYLNVAYSPSLGMYLAVGEVGLMATSTDGVNWTDRSQPAPIYGSSLSAVAWNSTDLYFAASDFGGYIYNSADGITGWTLNTINPNIQYQGSYYTYVFRITYEPSFKKFLVFGQPPPV